MFNFQPSPELMKQMLGQMPQQMQPQGMPSMGGNTGFTGGMPMPQGLDVGAGMSRPMPMQDRQMMPPMGMPPAQPPMPMGKPMSKPMGNSGGLMKNYASQTKASNTNKRRAY